MVKSNSELFFFCLALCFFFSDSSFAQDWPSRGRDNHHNPVVSADRIPVDFNREPKNVKWSAKIGMSLGSVRWKVPLPICFSTAQRREVGWLAQLWDSVDSLYWRWSNLLLHQSLRNRLPEHPAFDWWNWTASGSLESWYAWEVWCSPWCRSHWFATSALFTSGLARLRIRQHYAHSSCLQEKSRWFSESETCPQFDLFWKENWKNQMEWQHAW